MSNLKYRRIKWSLPLSDKEKKEIKAMGIAASQGYQHASNRLQAIAVSMSLAAIKKRAMRQKQALDAEYNISESKSENDTETTANQAVKKYSLIGFAVIIVIILIWKNRS